MIEGKNTRAKYFTYPGIKRIPGLSRSIRSFFAEDIELGIELVLKGITDWQRG